MNLNRSVFQAHNKPLGIGKSTLLRETQMKSEEHVGPRWTSCLANGGDDSLFRRRISSVQTCHSGGYLKAAGTNFWGFQVPRCRTWKVCTGRQKHTMTMIKSFNVMVKLKWRAISAVECSKQQGLFLHDVMSLSYTGSPWSAFPINWAW